MKINLNLKTKLILSFAVLISIPLAVSCYITYKISFSTIDTISRSLVMEKEKQKAEKVQEKVDQIDQISMSILSDDTVQNDVSFSSNELRYFLYGIRTNQPYIRNISIYPLDSKEMNKYPWAQQVEKKKGIGIWFTDDSRTVFYRRMIPSLKEPGKFIGILEFSMDKSLFNALLVKDSNEKMNYTDDLVDTNNRSLNDQPSFSSSLYGSIKEKTNGSFLANANGVKTFVYYDTISKTNWKYIFMIPENSLFSSFYSIQTKIYFYIIFTIVISIAIAYAISVQLSRPISDLIDHTTFIEKGDLTVNLRSYSNDEMGILIVRFNNMAKKLASFIRNIFTSFSISNRIFSKISEQSHVIQSSFSHVSSKVNHLINQAKHQSHELEKGMQTAEELSKHLGEMVTHIDFSHQLMDETHVISQKGLSFIQTLNEKFASEEQAVQSMSRHIKELETHSQSIARIISFIQDTSYKIELLALNAGIEAKRSQNEHGFSVISREIKQLSDATKFSLNDIIKSIGYTMKTMKLTSEEGSKLLLLQQENKIFIQNVNDSFSDIAGSVGNVHAYLHQLKQKVSLIEQFKMAFLSAFSDLISFSQVTSEYSIDVEKQMNKQNLLFTDLMTLIQQAEEDIHDLKENIQSFKIDDKPLE